MELHPILECGDLPNSSLWYVISSVNSPSARVGQACVFNHCCHTLYIIAGADPSTTHKDIYKLDLLSQTWIKFNEDTLEERYEHCSFIPQAKSTNIYVFGGANKDSNLNSVQVIETETGKCSAIACKGNVPSSRTLHSAAWDGNILYVWGGGQQGAVPVPDLQLHMFNAENHMWTQPPVSGKLPSARHGHAMVIVGKNLYIHGGMCGTTFHKDMHLISLSDFKCMKAKSRGDIPSGRAAHAICSFNKYIYIFGGMCGEGALDDMYQFNTANTSWTKLKFQSPPPTPRLDHSMVLAYLPYTKKQSEEESNLSASNEGATKNEVSPLHVQSDSTHSDQPCIIPLDAWSSHGDADSVNVPSTQAQFSKLQVSDSASTKEIPVCLVFGGMDTSGNLFNDVLVLRLNEV